MFGNITYKKKLKISLFVSNVDLDRIKKVVNYSTTRLLDNESPVKKEDEGVLRPDMRTNQEFNEGTTENVSATLTSEEEATLAVKYGPSNKPITFNTRDEVMHAELELLEKEDPKIRKEIIALLSEFKKNWKSDKHKLQQQHMPHSLLKFYRKLVPATMAEVWTNMNQAKANYESGKTTLINHAAWGHEMTNYLACIRKINKLFIRMILFNRIITAIKANADSSYVKAYNEACLEIVRYSMDLSPILKLIKKDDNTEARFAFTSTQTLTRIKKALDEIYNLLRKDLIPAYASYDHNVHKRAVHAPLVWLSESLEQILPTYVTRATYSGSLVQIPRFTRSAEYIVHLLRMYVVKEASPKLVFAYTIALNWPNFSKMQEKQVINYLGELYPLLLFITSISDQNKLPAGLFPDTYYIRLKFEDFFMTPAIKLDEKGEKGETMYMSRNTFASLITTLEHTMLNMLISAFNTK